MTPDDPPTRKKPQRGKYAENIGPPLSSSASYPSLAVQISCWPEEMNCRGRKYAENTEQRLSSSAPFPSLAVQIFCRPEEETPQRREVRREYRAAAVFLSRPLPPLAVQVFCRPEGETPQRRKYAENTERPLSCSAPFPSLRFKFSAGPNRFERRGKQSMAKIVSVVVISPRPPTFSRLKFRHHEEKTAEAEVRREYRATIIFLCDLPISRGLSFLLARR